MAPNSRSDMATKPQLSVETAVNSAPPPYESNNDESCNTDHELDGTISLVNGRWTPVPQTYNPETYDPEWRMLGTPEPEPYDPETYTAWGRKHFGDDWYEQRKTMLQERNIYVPDAVYVRRQKALRVLEHKIEGRPFKPRDGVLDKGWKRLWARLSNVLPSMKTPTTPESFRSRDSDSDLSGYKTYAPTPEPRSRSPSPDRWEQLEVDRIEDQWSGERYYFERIFLKEVLIDGTRSKRETEEGNKRAREEREAVCLLKWTDPRQYEVESAKNIRRKRDYDLQCNGWTQEQIEAADRADEERGNWRWNNPPPTFFNPSLTQEEKNAYYAWEKRESDARLRIYGTLPPNSSLPTQEYNAAYDAWRRGIHACVSGQHEEQPEPGAGAVADVSAIEEALQPRASPSPPKTHSGRITKSSAQDQGIDRNAPILADAPTHDGQSRSSDGALDVPTESVSSAQRKPRRRRPKAYEKERESRRLRGQPPEYGLLPERRRAPPTPTIGAKPQGISKPGQAGTGRPRRSARVTRGLNR